MKKRFVLRALTILDPEMIQKLLYGGVSESVNLKMAAGAESIPVPISASRQTPEKNIEAKILEFPKKKVHEMPGLPADSPNAKTGSEYSELSSTEFELWQKEMGKKHLSQSLDPHASYEKNLQVFIVKTKNEAGKSQSKLAKIQGVLLDKKSS